MFMNLLSFVCIVLPSSYDNKVFSQQMNVVSASYAAVKDSGKASGTVKETAVQVLL